MLNLKQKSMDLNIFKDGVVHYLLKEQEKLGFIRNESEYEREYEKLKKKVFDANIITQLREQSDRTNSEDFNKTLEEMYIDLLTAFEQMNAVTDTLDKHNELNNSVISNFKSRMYNILDEVSVLEDRVINLASAGNQVIHVEHFRTTDSYEPDVSMYRDDYGEQLSDSYIASFDKHNECIRIPRILSMNKLTSVNGQKMAEIKVNKQLGSGFVNIKNPSNNIDRAIDTDMESYWEEVILSDQPINVELDKVKYYQTAFGAVCEVEITFNNITEINEISLDAFGRFPLNIVAIKYYHTDQPDDEEEREGPKEIVSPTMLEPGLQSKTIRNGISFQFPAVEVKRVRILLNQEHYIKSSFIYDKRENEKNNIWFGTSGKVDFKFDAKYKGMYNDKLLTNRAWIMFNKAVEGQGTLDLEELLFPKKTELIPVTKYQYEYGLYNVSINENDYKDVGIYISRPIAISSNIASVKLDVDEYKPLGDDYGIKYYISAKSDPKGDEDWVGILPSGSEDVFEILSFKQDPTDAGSVVANMDFIPKQVIVLMRDYVFDLPDYTIDGKIIKMAKGAFSPVSTYTIKYTPHEMSELVDFRQSLSAGSMDLSDSQEVFHGTRSSTVTLNSIPKINFEDKKIPINIVITDGQGNSVYEPDEIQNVTSIHNPRGSSINFDKDTSIIQYYFYKNKIYFNQNISSDNIIEVNYTHFVNSIRFKTVLTRSEHSEGGVSPILNSYKLTFQTLE